MSEGPLENAERLLREDLAPVEDVLNTYGGPILRSGDLPELIELVEAVSPSGRWAVARWIESGDLTNGGAPSEAGDDPLAGVDLVNLAEFLERPDAFDPPAPVAYGIAYEGQATLLYGDPKGGKSTTAIGAGAAVSSGSPWMTHPTEAGPVLYLAAEGGRRHLLRRHAEFGARPENLDLVVPGVEPVKELRSLMQYRDYRLVVIDTLGKFMAPLGIDRWKQSEVDTVLTPLERTIREFGAALVALHHANSEGRPIDSTGFAAWADVLRKIEDGENERERVVTGRARFEVPDLRFQLFESEDGSELVPVDGDRDVKNRILDFLRSHEDATTRAIRSGVGADNNAIDAAVRELKADGIVTVDDSGIANNHRITENPRQHATSTEEAR